MTPVSMSRSTLSHQLAPLQKKGDESNALVHQTSNEIGDDEKAQLMQAEPANPQAQSAYDSIESFAYGALGMRRPEEVKSDSDTSYTAGQYLKGAIALGTILFAIV